MRPPPADSAPSRKFMSLVYGRDRETLEMEHVPKPAGYRTESRQRFLLGVVHQTRVAAGCGCANPRKSPVDRVFRKNPLTGMLVELGREATKSPLGSVQDQTVSVARKLALGRGDPLR